jgi:carbohydrate kinase (thermoresistant glucokinase family)
MGVSGSGKTTLGQALAQRLGWAFSEGDEHHPPANLAKMARGEPLDDADRLPWLEALHRIVVDHANAGRDLILACSALKRRYRDLLTRGVADSRFVFLRGDSEAIAGRLATRSGHFMPPSLLASQYADLEPPADALVVSATLPTDRQVQQVVDALQRYTPP